MSATILPFSIPKSDAIMSLHSTVPETAMTADLLGTQRRAHAVQITAEGLMLTVGYAIMEASEIWLNNHRGQSSEGIVLAHDYDSGIALIRPNQQLGTSFIQPAPAGTLNVGDEVSILISNERKPQAATLLAKEEYAGRWEYLLEEALYTVPLCEDWSGAALLNSDEQLCGIGSLAIGLKSSDGESLPGNLFIPTSLVIPHLEVMCQNGKKPGQLRPWLGTLVDVYDDELHVVGLYLGGPAAEAGISPGDVIVAVGEVPVSSLAGFFRAIWLYGPAGTKIPLTMKNGSKIKDVVLDTIDRESFFVQHSVNFVS